MNQGVIDKFWARVKKGDQCWEWIGAHNSKGYGHLFIDGRNIGAHRVSWMIHFGEIPSEKVVCHHCDNPKCVNPAHLFIGSQKENLMDRDKKGRSITGTKNGRYTKPERTARGERSGKARFTNEQANWIRAQYASGIQQRSLARYFGVHKDTIYRIVNGLSYQEA